LISVILGKSYLNGYELTVTSKYSAFGVLTGAKIVHSGEKAKLMCVN
jgi:hypothetical protein